MSELLIMSALEVAHETDCYEIVDLKFYMFIKSKLMFRHMHDFINYSSWMIGLNSIGVCISYSEGI